MNRYLSERGRKELTNSIGSFLGVVATHGFVTGSPYNLDRWVERIGGRRGGEGGRYDGLFCQ